jgi:hypothetical protein
MARIALLLCLVALSACRVFLRTWTTVYLCPLPDGAAVLKVETLSNFGDEELRVVVNRGWQSKEIAYRSDCSLNFAHGAWQESVVAVFIDGGYCGQIRIAYDATTQRAIDFKAAEPWLRAAIIKSYTVSADELRRYRGDVFEWATDRGDGWPRRGSIEFERRSAR